jgi:integrase
MGAAVRVMLAPRGTNGPYFPNLHGEPFSAWSVHVRKFTRDCGFGDWCLHDLRRTLATRWQAMGIDIATTEKMLSHSAITGGLVGVYQRHSYLAEMRTAVQAWENHLHALLSTTEGINV